MTLPFLCLIDTIMGYYINPECVVQLELQKNGMNSEYAKKVGDYLATQVSKSISEDLVSELMIQKENMLQRELTDTEFYCVKRGIEFSIELIKKIMEV